MAKIAIIGGNLTGSGVAYLSREARIDAILIDKDPQAPAQNLCSQFICGDVFSADPRITSALDSADMILPATGSESVLKGLTELAEKRGYILAFHRNGHKAPSSEYEPCHLFEGNELPYPLYAVEVIGQPGEYRTYEITEIFMDNGYNHSFTAALHTITPAKRAAMNMMAIQAAEQAGLVGIMELKILDYRDDLKVWEINAGFPSQTPVVVYNASGMNYVKELYDLFCEGGFTDEQINNGKCASLIHYLFHKDRNIPYESCNISKERPLYYTGDICSKSVVISNFSPRASTWKGIFINQANNIDELENKESLMRYELKQSFGEAYTYRYA